MEIGTYGRLTKVWEEDAYHSSCNHPALPQDTTTVIDLDLTGHKDPSIQALQAELDPQEPDTARMFLCSSHIDARDIFRNLGMGGSERYVDCLINEEGDQSVQFQLDEREILVPYDPRRLFDWISLVPGRTVTLVVSEFVAVPRKRLAEQIVVHSQVRVSRDTDNRYRVIWFDFRDSFTNLPSHWQRCFAYRIHHQEGRLCEKLRCASDFPAYLLLEILETDMKAFEPLVLQQHKVFPAATLRRAGVASIHDYVTQRFEHFEFLHWMTEKAEAIHNLATYLNNTQTLALLSEGQRIPFSRASHQVEISSSFLLSEVRRQDKQAEDQLNLHNRIEQGRQASSMSALTYCAAFFLPLSLAASFLSMQNRAKDLGVIVYDFFGITLALMTIAAITYFGSRAISKLKTYVWATRQAGKTWPVPLLNIRLWRAISAFVWVLVIVSFFVGMIHDLRIGLIILGATGAAVVVPFILFELFVVLYTLGALFVKTFKWVRKVIRREMTGATALHV